MVEVSLRSFHFHLLQGFCDADKIQAKEGHQDQDQGSSSKLRQGDYSSENSDFPSFHAKIERLQQLLVRHY
jgi:hypothetical protein